MDEATLAGLTMCCLVAYQNSDLFGAVVSVSGLLCWVIKSGAW